LRIFYTLRLLLLLFYRVKQYVRSTALYILHALCSFSLYSHRNALAIALKNMLYFQ